MSDTVTSIRLTAAVQLEAAAAGDRPKRLRINAYSGSTMNVGGYSPTVVSLEGMQLANPLPILDGHQDTLGSLIAQGAPTIIGTRLSILATVLPGQAGEHTLNLLAAGAALQASIGLEIQQQRILRSGETATVNAKDFTAGPAGLRIVEKSALRETSILPAGADSSTSVQIAARAAGASMNETISTPPPIATPIDADAIRAEERQRLRAIDTIVGGLHLDGAARDQVDTLRGRAVAGELTLDGLRTGCLDLIRASRATSPIIGARGHVTSANHLAAAIMVRAGYSKAAEKEFGADALQQSRRLHSASLVDMCKAALVIDGRDVPDNRNELIKASLSTGSMPVALGNTANKVMVAAYQQAPAAWRSFAAVKSAANFKTQSGIRPSFLGDLEALPPGGEVKHGHYQEEVYSWSVGQYAKQLQVDRTDIINDDASVFSDVLPSFARAAARTLNSLVATTILANAGSFWSTGNLNYQEGSGTALSASSLSAAILLLRQMKDAEGGPLDLQPAVLLAPPQLETTARGLLESMEIARSTATDSQLPTGNVHKGQAALAIEPRLSDSDFTGYSTTGWYLFSDPTNAAVVVGFLDGQEAPTVETFGLDADINHLAFGFRVYFDFGCALADFRAAIRSKGAA